MKGTGTITDLGTLGGDFSHAKAVNDSGQVVGWSATASGETHAFLFDGSTLHDLGTLGGSASSAEAINNAGLVVGSSNMGAVNDYHAFLYHDGTMTDVGSAWPGVSSGAVAINNHGQIVCIIRTRAVASKATGILLWQAGTVREVVLPSDSLAEAVNDAGAVVGVATVALGRSHAFLHDGATLHDLGTLGGPYSFTFGLNNHGDVVGESSMADGRVRAFLWCAGAMTSLGTLGGQDSIAYGVNDRRQIVGNADLPVASHMADAESKWHAFLWHDGVMSDLNDMLPAGTNWELTEARGVNNRGQIVGTGIHNGLVRAFLFTPRITP